MELIRGLHNIRDKHRGCVLTIGKFDGVHLGHQAVLRQVVAKARELQLPATVMVFEPQPEEVFRPDAAPARLTRWRDKYEQLARLGVDRLLCVKFDRRFAQMSADAFIQKWLVGRLGVGFLVVGDDFRFGHGRQGDYLALQRAGEAQGFTVVNTDSFRLADCRISSSAVRAALEQGDLVKAAQLLGRPFAIAGKVVHGDKKGRTIGFPTANVLLKRCRAPVAGVFAVRAWLGDTCFTGVANVGTRPTVGGLRSQLEVHLFDVSLNIYAQRINVELLHKIRDEHKFDSLSELQTQIRRDADAAKAWLAAQPGQPMPASL